MPAPSNFPRFMKRTSGTRLLPRFMEPLVQAFVRRIRDFSVRITRTLEEEVRK